MDSQVKVNQEIKEVKVGSEDKVTKDLVGKVDKDSEVNVVKDLGDRDLMVVITVRDLTKTMEVKDLMVETQETKDILAGKVEIWDKVNNLGKEGKVDMETREDTVTIKSRVITLMLLTLLRTM